MSELEENWQAALREAEQKARAEGRADVLDYLRLREINDAARRVGIRWLFDTFLEIAAEANRRGMPIEIEKNEAHRFAAGAATMRGALLRLKLGIRSMTIEAGFPRLPQDGFVRGGGLACARISHFGLAKANEDLMLIRSENSAPIWFTVVDNNFREAFQIARLKHHFETFLGRI